MRCSQGRASRIYHVDLVGFSRVGAPEIAIISCGEGNKFGHPQEETLDKLAAAGVTVYRTDKVGTIILISDGKKVTYKVNSVG